jgi:hypothetical protein
MNLLSVAIHLGEFLMYLNEAIKVNIFVTTEEYDSRKSRYRRQVEVL